MKNKYNACIIGCGSIGTSRACNHDNPEDDSNILTIAHAMHAHPRINLEYMIDLDYAKAEKAAKKWNVPMFDASTEYIEKDEIDIIAVAVPTEYHFSVLKDIIKLRPKLVIAEKPFCNNLKEARSISDIYSKANIPILVDYIRNYEPIHQNMTKNLISGNLGKIYHCKLTYTRGTIREASHFINLCNNWFGECWLPLTYLNKFSPIIDLDEKDPTYFVHLSYEKCPHVTLHPVDGRKYKVFEIDIYTEQGRFVFSSHGRYLDYYSVVPEPIYGEFNCLLNNLLKVQLDRIETGLTTALSNLIQNAVDVIEHKTIPYCNDRDAIHVWEVFGSLGLGE